MKTGDLVLLVLAVGAAAAAVIYWRRSAPQSAISPGMPSALAAAAAASPCMDRQGHAIPCGGDPTAVVALSSVFKGRPIRIPQGTGGMIA